MTSDTVPAPSSDRYKKTDLSHKIWYRRVHGCGIHHNNNILPSCESFMNGKRYILPLLVLCFILSISGLCSGEDQKTPLIVKNIIFTPDKTRGDRITLLCNQSCAPELYSLEGKNPRVVMDMKGVSLIQTKARNVNIGGRLVKRIRSHLNKQTSILRVVLDMEPSKSYIVRPMQDPSGNYMLTIKEDADSPQLQKKRITILFTGLRPEGQKGNLQEAEPSPENLSAVKAAEDVPFSRARQIAVERR